MSHSKLSIAVVGGSISGCMTARLLMSAGYEVQVFERSPTGLVGRGGGVATSRQVIEQLKHDGLIAADFPTVPHSHLRFAKRAMGHEAIGRCPWRPELDMECVHWSGLFQALRQGIRDDFYHLAKELVDVTTHDNSRPAELSFADGTTAEADLVVFTDGFRSLGRRLMFPDVQLDYRGFAVWRGVIGETACKHEAALNDHPRLSLASMPGSFVTYLMPSESGSTTPGERVINWAVYLPLDAAELPQAMRDRDGRVREGTIPAGAFPLSEEQRLKSLMREQLPTVYSDIVEASENTQFQPIRISRVPEHVQSRLCLVGDAAVAIQPLTGAGVFKALENARSLVAALESHTTASMDLDDALSAWSRSQTELDQRLLATGFELEQAFIWKTIDLATASLEQVQQWWGKAVNFPRDYSYLKVE